MLLDNLDFADEVTFAVGSILPSGPTAVLLTNGTSVASGATIATNSLNSTCDSNGPCNSTWAVSECRLEGRVEGQACVKRMTKQCMQSRMQEPHAWGIWLGQLPTCFRKPTEAPSRQGSRHSCTIRCCPPPCPPARQLACANGYNASATGGTVDWTTGGSGAQIPMSGVLHTLTCTLTLTIMDQAGGMGSAATNLTVRGFLKPDAIQAYLPSLHCVQPCADAPGGH